MGPLRFVFGLHLHQPVGNFDHVMGDHVRDVYRPIIERAIAAGFYPLTFPLTVGPGSISVAITLGAGAATGSPAGLVTTVAYLAGAGIVSASISVCYRSASYLSRVLGETAPNVFLRLSAFILLCVGVSIFWSGVVGLVQTTRW